MPPIETENWIETFRQLLHHYLPPLESTPLVNVLSLAVAAAGIFLVFKSWRFERSVVCIFALVLGAWLGSQVAGLVGTPGPITAAVTAVALTLLAYKSYKWWLAGGSVVLLFGIALIFQLGRGDLHRYLPTVEEGAIHLNGDFIGPLVSAEQQEKNVHPDWRDQAGKIKDKIVSEIKSLGPSRWLLPALAAILGGLLAFWALRAFSVVWLGFLGAIMSVLGACTFLCANWPDIRTRIIDDPRITGGAIVGLWLLGLVLQAKEARFPKKQPASEAKDSSKS